MKRLWSTRKWLIVLAAVLAAALLGFGAPALVTAHPEGTISADSDAPIDTPTLSRLAETLEITPAELVSQLQTGKTLARIAGERNIPSEALIDAIIVPTAEQIALEVKYGYITQEQAQGFLDAARQRASYLLEQDLSTTQGSAYDYYSYFGHCGDYMMGGYGLRHGWRMAGPGMMWGWGGYYNSPALAPPTTSGGTGFPSRPRNWGRGWGIMGCSRMGRW